ncbi:MAG: hypothetical protein KUF79_17500 [Candidatus Thiodiazotropha sp. (ex Ctena orbiculata)]|nr:hypothetical protein [Candidatus Thiodiazotropha taylori]
MSKQEWSLFFNNIYIYSFIFTSRAAAHIVNEKALTSDMPKARATWDRVAGGDLHSQKRKPGKMWDLD